MYISELFVVKSEWVLFHYIQLIVTVRSSAPPRNPSSGVADDLSGEDSGSLNDDTRQVLKVCRVSCTQSCFREWYVEMCFW